ncbi:hypothetical protein HIM_01613 [Hirsutella minnesotensis 3608]|nr:hypothetical protein HIM_01613 [Hirsutella minnesotensis 3608]
MEPANNVASNGEQGTAGLATALRDHGGRDSAVQNHGIAALPCLETAHTSQKSSYPPANEVAHPQLSTASSPNMIFSDFYKGPRSPLAKLRNHHSHPPSQIPTTTPDWVAPEHADLLSKDKTKQKEAVKRYLSQKIRNDWEFSWPPHSQAAPASVGDAHATQTAAPADVTESPEPKPVQDETRDEDGYQVDEDSDAERPLSEEECRDGQNDDARSVYSIVSEDAMHYRPRIESASDVSDDEELAPCASSQDTHPDAMRLAAQKRTVERQARRRRAIRDEMTYNEGLACFEARRNAWTGARTVRVRSKPPSPTPTSPRSPRRFFFRHSPSGISPPSLPPVAAQSAEVSGAASDASSHAKDTEKDLKTQKTRDSAVSDPSSADLYPIETLIPVGQPLLPPNNALRAAIVPAVYVNLYDKVVVNNAQPACPINLADMLRSCVAGWKRDGEWPPRSAAVDFPNTASRRTKRSAGTAPEHGGNASRRMSFGLLGREKDDEYRSGKGLRRSLQRALGIGLVPGSTENGEGVKTKEV